MAEKRQILDDTGGVLKEFLVEDDEVYLVSRQDVEPFIEDGKSLQGDGYWRTRTARHFAEVPFNIVMKWCNEEGIKPVCYMSMNKYEKEALVRKKLGNSDYAAFRRFWETPSSRVALSQPLIGD